NGTPATTGGQLAAATYYLQVTASPAQTSVEQKIYQVGSGTVTTGSTGSISITLPTLTGFVFNVYIGTSTSPTNLAVSASGPSTGPLAGMATQLASGSTVVLTGVGAAQTPPAAPATGVTVFPTYFFGTDAYGQVLLDNVQYHYLRDADKSDPMNQTRVVSWKMMYGTIILNNAYMARVESGSAFSPGYTAGTATE
ncbi:MAG: N4-gp56 family major capsid protein, partial [Burkholderiales bacterium 21-58-4]